MALKKGELTLRRELLNAYLFNSLAQVRAFAEEWRFDYNAERPHKALGYLSPLNYLAQQQITSALSTPASRNTLKIEATPVVDNSVKSKNTKFEKL